MSEKDVILIDGDPVSRRDFERAYPPENFGIDPARSFACSSPGDQFTLMEEAIEYNKNEMTRSAHEALAFALRVSRNRSGVSHG